MKQFSLRLLFLLPLLFGMVLTSWIVDPDHVRDPEGYERGIARLLLDGKPVTNIAQADEAAILQYYFADLTSIPDVMVIGSSRTKLLRADSFPGQTFFNASLSGASLTDYLAITNLVESRGGLPRTMVIELSTFLLSDELVSVWPQFGVHKDALEAHFINGAPAPSMVGTSAPTFESYARFLQPDYFQLSFYTLLDSRLGDAQGSDYHVLQKDEEPTGLTYLADGSEIFPPQRRKNLGKDSVTALAIDAGQYSAGIPKSIVPEQQRVLEAYLAYLQAHDVKVVLFLAPYHPVSYEIMLGNRYSIIVDIQAYYEDLAARLGLPLVGSFNPGDLGITKDVYYDATHITPEALAGIFAGMSQP
jgi:hypothetical protein